MTVLPFGEFFNSDESVPLMLANLEVGILLFWQFLHWVFTELSWLVGHQIVSILFLAVFVPLPMISCSWHGIILVANFFMGISTGVGLLGLSLVDIVRIKHSAWLFLVQPLSALFLLIALFVRQSIAV